jgi:hypothetical protein
MHVLTTPLRLVRENLRPYLVLSALIYGLFAAGLVTGLLLPNVTAAQVAEFESSPTAEYIRSLVAQPLLFALIIFANNALRAGLLSIVLPSLLIPHSLTLIIEFQAYILFALGAVVLGRAWIRPSTVGATTRRSAYVTGLRRLATLAILALALLVIGALYEAFSVRYLLPLFAG